MAEQGPDITGSSMAPLASLVPERLQISTCFCCNRTTLDPIRVTTRMLHYAFEEKPGGQHVFMSKSKLWCERVENVLGLDTQVELTTRSKYRWDFSYQVADLRKQFLSDSLESWL